MHLLYRSTTSGRSHGSPLVWASQPFSSPQLSHNDSLWALGRGKSHREQGLDYWGGISPRTPLKPRHSNPNLNYLANQVLSIDFLTSPTPLIIAHRLPAFFESLMPFKNWCSIHARWSKSSLKHSIRFSGILSKFKTEFYCISFF